MKFVSRIAFATALALAASGAALAQDVTDDATCLECHDGTERSAPADPNMIQVHNPEGGFFAEAHEMWACVDCHTYVEEIPHAEDVSEQVVDCLNCHAEVPTK
ncbi:MAG: hypothetical protein PVI83_09900 [Lysobacterales bacterium]|jgi:hypothetical protein